MRHARLSGSLALPTVAAVPRRADTFVNSDTFRVIVAS